MSGPNSPSLGPEAMAIVLPMTTRNDSARARGDAPQSAELNLDSGSGTLLDERTRPDFRDVFGTLACESAHIATAITRVRLTTVDLARSELRRVESFRVLLAELNALQLHAEARALEVDPKRAHNLALLLELLDEGRLAVRCAPLAGWAPDFTVFFDAGGPTDVMIGTHWFERPYPHPGPALVGLFAGQAAHLAAQRFAALWDRAHDVGPAVRGVLARRM